MKKWFFTYKFYIFLSIASLIVLVIGYYILDRHSKNFQPGDWVDFWGYSLAFLLLLLTLFQTFSANDWNRRKQAYDTLKAIKDENSDYARILDRNFGFIERSPECPISPDEIHDAICVKDEKGNFEKNNNGKLKLDPNKAEIREAIRNTLSNYEYLASGVYNGILDEKIVLDLFKGNIKKVYKIFSPYIEHVNETMYPYRNKTIWVNFKTYAKKLDDENELHRTKN